MQTNIHFLSYLAQLFLEFEMFRTDFVKEIKAHILCSINLFFENWAESETTLKYGRIKQATDDNIISRMRIACWMTKATNTHSEYLTLIVFFPLQTWLQRKCLNITLYAHYLFCPLFVRSRFEQTLFHINIS